MKKTYKRILACAAVLSMLPITAFGTQWYDEAVAYCTEKGIIYEDYNTDGLLTRGEMAKMQSSEAAMGAAPRSPSVREAPRRRNREGCRV